MLHRGDQVIVKAAANAPIAECFDDQPIGRIDEYRAVDVDGTGLVDDYRCAGAVFYGVEKLFQQGGFAAAQRAGQDEEIDTLCRRNHIRLLQLLPLNPIAMEGLDDGIIEGLKERGMKLADIAELPAGNAWLMIEFGALSTEDAIAFAQKAVDIAPELPGRPSVRLVTDAGLMNRIWTIRETGASATSLGLDPNEPDPVVGWEDAAVEPEHLGKYLREFKSLVSNYGYKTNLYGHFGDGCIHSRITFDLKSQDGLDNWRAFLDEAAHLVVRYGGSLSGEHGDGQAKGEYLRIMYSAEIMNAFAEFKAIWDPLNKMNPGKLIHAMPVDANLRLGPDYKRREIPSQFTYDPRLGDKGLARESERCIGMGKCRSLEGGTMCPSFRATRDEKYSTRGRARLFFELLKGEVIEDGWQNEEVKDSLDLCLSCKGCKTDCPTNVNIARYKTEFLNRYYSEKRRPVMDAMIGRIGEWLPHATKFSPVLNYAMGNPLVRTAGSYFGLARHAKFPKIAAKSFRSGVTAQRILKNQGQATVAALESKVREIGKEKVAAFICEPIIGSGGVIVPPAGYLKAMRETCDRLGILLIVDEVITGFGRTGPMFACEHEGVSPDILTLAKGLTSGYAPMGATIISDSIYAAIAEAGADGTPFGHGQTYAGHPVSAAIANATLDLYETGLLENGKAVGEYFQERLRSLEALAVVGQVRGQGMLAGVELVTDKHTRAKPDPSLKIGQKILAHAFSEGLVFRAFADDILGFAPSLNYTNADVDKLIEILTFSIEKVIGAKWV